jgi:catechol 2,3-dioxygenase-like lactoylglutathione lyase family enzyme
MADTTFEIQANDAASEASVAKVDMKFEIVVIPVSDVDRAKEFYARLGWRLDGDYDNGKDFRVIQFTPPGSGCSVILGKNVTGAAPGSAQGLYLIVDDIEAARQNLLGHSVEVSEVFHGAADVYSGSDEPYLFGRIRVNGPDPEHRSYRSHRRHGDDLCIGERSGKRVSACGGRSRRAREAHRAAGRELGRLVCRLHGGGAVRQRAAAMNDSAGTDIAPGEMSRLSIAGSWRNHETQRQEGSHHRRKQWHRPGHSPPFRCRRR